MNKMSIFNTDEKGLSTNKAQLQDLAKKAKEYFDNALSKQTQKLYADDWRMFETWAMKSGFNPLPAEPGVIVLFLTHQAESEIEYNGKRIKRKPTTLIRRLAAIRYKHEIMGFPSPTQDRRVRNVLDGIKRAKGMAVNKKEAATPNLIERMIAHCPDTLTGTRDKALLLLGFAGAFRRSELVALTTDDIERTPEGIKVTIRKSKTDQEGKGKTIAVLNGKRFPVVQTLMQWLDAAGISDGYLFRSIKKGGLVQSLKLNERSVADIIKKYAEKAGLDKPNFSGHSLRRGFITAGAMSGATIFKLMEVSRHVKPETVMEYINNAKLFEDHSGEKFL